MKESQLYSKHTQLFITENKYYLLQARKDYDKSTWCPGEQ